MDNIYHSSYNCKQYIYPHITYENYDVDPCLKYRSNSRDCSRSTSESTIINKYRSFKNNRSFSSSDIRINKFRNCPCECHNRCSCVCYCCNYNNNNFRRKYVNDYCSSLTLKERLNEECKNNELNDLKNSYNKISIDYENCKKENLCKDELIYNLQREIENLKNIQKSNNDLLCRENQNLSINVNKYMNMLNNAFETFQALMNKSNEPGLRLKGGVNYYFDHPLEYKDLINNQKKWILGLPNNLNRNGFINNKNNYKNNPPYHNNNYPPNGLMNNNKNPFRLIRNETEPYLNKNNNKNNINPFNNSINNEPFNSNPISSYPYNDSFYNNKNNILPNNKNNRDPQLNNLSNDSDNFNNLPINPNSLGPRTYEIGPNKIKKNSIPINNSMSNLFRPDFMGNNSFNGDPNNQNFNNNQQQPFEPNLSNGFNIPRMNSNSYRNNDFPNNNNRPFNENLIPNDNNMPINNNHFNDNNNNNRRGKSSTPKNPNNFNNDYLQNPFNDNDNNNPLFDNNNPLYNNSRNNNNKTQPNNSYIPQSQLTYEINSNIDPRLDFPQLNNNKNNLIDDNNQNKMEFPPQNNLNPNKHNLFNNNQPNNLDPKGINNNFPNKNNKKNHHQRFKSFDNSNNIPNFNDSNIPNFNDNKNPNLNDNNNPNFDDNKIPNFNDSNSSNFNNNKIPNFNNNNIPHKFGNKPNEYNNVIPPNNQNKNIPINLINNVDNRKKPKKYPPNYLPNNNQINPDLQQQSFTGPLPNRNNKKKPNNNNIRRLNDDDDGFSNIRLNNEINPDEYTNPNLNRSDKSNKNKKRKKPLNLNPQNPDLFDNNNPKLIQKGPKNNGSSEYLFNIKDIRPDINNDNNNTFQNSNGLSNKSIDNLFPGTKPKKKKKSNSKKNINNKSLNKLLPNYYVVNNPYSPKSKNPLKYTPSLNDINVNKFHPKKSNRNKRPKSSHSRTKSPKSPKSSSSTDIKKNPINIKKVFTSDDSLRSRSGSKTRYFPNGNCWACELGCSVSTTGYSPMTFSPYKNTFRRRDVTPMKEGTKFEQYLRHKKGDNASYYLNASFGI